MRRWTMRGSEQLLCAALAASLVAGAPQAVGAQDMTAHPAVRNLEDIQLAPAPGFPGCVRGAVQSGDPATGPSVMLGEMDAGCVIPWHWHTPNEHLMLVKGEAVVEMRSGELLKLRPGGFALMPSGHVHQFRCTEECTLFVHSDTALDIRYVDALGTEIGLEEALALLGETRNGSR
jgi:quercetin dioxygenase-like cupin family protein